jgi:mannose-6-phosphate isomerase-like protein (cupin superfamily)
LTIYTELSLAERPTWSDVTSAGTFRVERNGRFDRHHHDCDEYWLIYQGSARILVGDHEYVITRGDIVCIETGLDHDVLEIYEPIEAFWFEGPLDPGGQAGHLHRTEVDLAGHLVPGRAEPPDNFTQGQRTTIGRPA